MSTTKADELTGLNREYRELTGEDFYLYSEHPGDVNRYAFRDGVIVGRGSALGHMRNALADEKLRRVGKE